MNIIDKKRSYLDTSKDKTNQSHFFRSPERLTAKKKGAG